MYKTSSKENPNGTPYNPKEIGYFALVEFFATTIAIILMAGPASLGSLIRYTGSNFTTPNGIFTIFLIGLTNLAALYTAHATYNRYKAGYVNILLAAVYIILGEWEKRKWWIFLKLIILMIMQLIGCLCAGLLLWGLLGDNGTNLGKPEIGPGIPWQRAFGVEIFFTFILIAVSVTANDPPKHTWQLQGSFVSSIALIATIVIGVPISGASLNWVRHFGSAAISNSFAPIDWIYYVGPFIGFIGAFVYIFVHDMFFAETFKFKKEVK